MDYFWNILESYKEKTALISEQETISYKKLSQIADIIAEDIKERSLVFLVCKNQIACVAGYLAFLRKRVVTVLLSSSIDTELFEKLIDIYKPQFVWCPEDFSKKSGTFFYGGYKLLETGNSCPETNEKLAVMIPTSGSTGSPKLVRLSYDNIQSNTESIAEYLKIVPDDKAITTLPMNYVYGLSIIQTHLFAGASVIVTENNVFDMRFWKLFKRHGATTFGEVPYVYNKLDKLDFLSMDLPSLRYITQAGGKLGKGLHYKIGKAMHEKGKKFIVMYGASEATARMSYVPSEIAEEKAGSVGVAIPGGRFELVDFDSTVITESDKEGELVYYGKNVMLGYARCREDLSKGDEMHGRLETGDMAKRDSDGFYYITGRKNRFVKAFGNRVNLEEIEGLLSEKGYDVACLGEDEHITIYTTSKERNKIVDYISEKTGLNSMVFEVITSRTIPRNQSGKIQYPKLRAFTINAK